MMGIFLAMFFPTAIFGGALYYIFDRMLSACVKGGSFQPELCIMEMTTVILIAFIVFMMFFLVYSLIVTNRLAGPIERLSKDLDDIVKGSKKGPLIIRPKDDLKPLVDNINTLLAYKTDSMQKTQNN